MKLETIGRNIDTIRKSRGYTTDELSKRAGISGASLSRHINGHTVPDMRMIITGLFLLKERMIITAKMITLRLEFRESKNKQLSFAVTKAEKIFVMLYQS